MDDARTVAAPAWAATLAAAGTASTVAGTSQARRVLKSPTVRAVRAVPQAELARAEAESLARAQAARLAELERAAAAAREEGYRAGVEETLAAGSAAAQRGADALEQLLAVTAAQGHREVSETAEAVVSAALHIAEWVLRRELDDAGHSLLRRLEAGLTALLPSPTTRIAVSHADHAVVTTWAEGRGRLGTTVLADARLLPGDAVVTTDAGAADLTVAAALRAAADALGAVRVEDPGTPTTAPSASTTTTSTASAPGERA